MAQTLIIDPPVSPYSEPEEIRAWISELERRKAASRVPDDITTYDEAIAEATKWLERQARA